MLIQVDRAVVEYSIDEFRGELYRMNVTCSENGAKESGCLFFKVIGESNVAKG